MNLVDHIKQHALASAQAGDWATVAETLNALTTEVRDSTLRSARWLMLNLTDVVAVTNGIPITESDIVLGTLQSPDLPPRVKAAYQSLCNGGLDLSEDQVQQMIPLLSLSGNWPTGLADKVAEAGRRDVAVLDTPVTADDCQTAWNAAQADQDYSTICNEVINPELSNPSRTKSSIAAKLREAVALLESPQPE